MCRGTLYSSETLPEADLRGAANPAINQLRPSKEFVIYANFLRAIIDRNIDLFQ